MTTAGKCFCALLLFIPIRRPFFTESQRIGTVMLVIRPNAIMKVLEETGNSEEVEFYLLDPEGRIMAANSGADTGKGSARLYLSGTGNLGRAGLPYRCKD